ncbi:hypothetical protein [Lutispora saccharofermentans]|uniref:Glycine reductase complex selenoprotein A n=1 Tax=Lutispora saccharofermentans TaxID=3024236 RepID=A0ABT1NM10_9FIRM|nr:hypothetical protein [Lutispora saccharofermentans]MCQ1531351.1 hypothetical protein [Lutispora saccharofermentans]
MILKGRKVIAIGDRDGVPGLDIKACAGDPTFAGPLAGVELGLRVYHIVEPEMKKEFDSAVYDEQCGMMEMVLDVDEIIKEVNTIRAQHTKFDD